MLSSSIGPSLACVMLGAGSLVQGLYLDVADKQSIRDVAAQIAGDLIRANYNPVANGVGLLGQPYYWWEAGAMWGGLVDYWAYTGDTSLNGLVADAILSQASPTNDFMMPNQHFDLGNDDQCLWALTAMSAAEHELPIPRDSKASPEVWYQLAKNAFDDMYGRWDRSTCGGGIRWQIYPSNAGYDYKSAIANAGAFQLAARLYRYTGDEAFLQAADRIHDWMAGIGLIFHDGPVGTLVFDGSGTANNCSTVDQHRWSYTAGSMLYGSAALAGSMGDRAASAKWWERTGGLLTGITNSFFGATASSPFVMYELVCEKYGSCNADELSFKAYLARWMGGTTQAYDAPFANAAVANLLRHSALAAAESCAGGEARTRCGTKWFVGGHDGQGGVGQQLSALEAVQSLLAGEAGLARLGSHSVKRRDEVSHRTVRRAVAERDTTTTTGARRRAWMAAQA